MKACLSMQFVKLQACPSRICLSVICDIFSVYCHSLLDLHFPVRLGGGKAPSEGRVEVLVKGIWGQVCDKGWAVYESRAVCRQLGYDDGLPFVKAEFGIAKIPMFIFHVRCYGNESILEACHIEWDQKRFEKVWGVQWPCTVCRAPNAAGVRCLKYRNYTGKAYDISVPQKHFMLIESLCCASIIVCYTPNLEYFKY